MVTEMTVAQFAHKLKVNRSTVYRMISGKALPVGVQAVTRLNRIEIHIDKSFVWKRE